MSLENLERKVRIYFAYGVLWMFQFPVPVKVRPRQRQTSDVTAVTGKNAEKILDILSKMRTPMTVRYWG